MPVCGCLGATETPTVFVWVSFFALLFPWDQAGKHKVRAETLAWPILSPNLKGKVPYLSPILKFIVLYLSRGLLKSHIWVSSEVGTVPKVLPSADSGTIQSCGLRISNLSRAGHFRYFWIFSIIKNDFFYIFYQVNNLFLHHSYLKSPLPVKLTW